MFPEFPVDHEMQHVGGDNNDHVEGGVQAVEGLDLGGGGDPPGDILPFFIKGSGLDETIERVRNNKIRRTLSIEVFSLRG